MNTVKRTVSAPPDAVWKVLADGWMYPLWVVGATRMREVEDEWPQVGARIHHSVGTWPVVLDDDTEVVESVPASKLVLRARAWPTGEAHVSIRIEPHRSGATITMEEDVVRGPARLVPKPVRAPVLKWRNTECLRRLGWLTERRG
jgi:uncharacterized protein YndB with AHSA1/START domain